jgi:2-keto-4-pentenoate hydratase
MNIRCWLLFALAAVVPPSRAEPPAPAVMRQAAETFLARQPVPGFGTNFDLAEALLAQKTFVKALEPRLGRPVGHKVALVNREAQERFGVRAPVSGVLLEKMLLTDDAEVPADFGPRPLVEADLIAVVKDARINRATTPLEAARSLKELVAFIELPDAILATNAPLTGPVFVALNAGARLGVLGGRAPVEATPAFVDALEKLKVTMIDDTGVVHGQVQGGAILDHPFNAVLWLVEDLKKTGGKLKAGDLISLGSLKAVPPVAGRTYRVGYDGLPGGPLEVSVHIKPAQ